MPSQTFGIGLVTFGSVLLYTALKNVSIGEAITGGATSHVSSASKFAAAASGDAPSDTTATPSPSDTSTNYADAAHVRGVSNFNGKPVASWIADLLTKAAKVTDANGKPLWDGRVNSGWRSYADQARIYASGQRPAAKPGTSNHEGTQFPRGAVDVPDAAGLAAALKHVPGGNLLVWAGSKDKVHFSHPHNGSY